MIKTKTGPNRARLVTSLTISFALVAVDIDREVLVVKRFVGAVSANVENNLTELVTQCRIFLSDGKARTDALAFNIIEVFTEEVVSLAGV